MLSLKSCFPDVFPLIAISLEAKGFPGARGVVYSPLLIFLFFSAVDMSNYFLKSCEVLEAAVSIVISVA